MAAPHVVGAIASLLSNYPCDDDLQSIFIPDIIRSLYLPNTRVKNADIPLIVYPTHKPYFCRHECHTLVNQIECSYYFSCAWNETQRHCN
jgi:hypothetical protein